MKEMECIVNQFLWATIILFSISNFYPALVIYQLLDKISGK